MAGDKSLKERFKKETESFNAIAEERKRHNQIPDMRVSFENDYFYNNIWRNSLFLRKEYGPICAWIVDNLKKEEIRSVVEVGCGNGWLSLELARNGFEVTGLDLSTKSIAIAKEYLSSLKENGLRIRYITQNIEKYSAYASKAVVSFGFLHHLPSAILQRFLKRLTQKDSPCAIFLAVEPRYDYASQDMALLIYALRRALPNHFKYPKSLESMKNAIDEIFAELSESCKEQSEMDNESPSHSIISAIRDHFPDVELDYSTAFYDKFIGSLRVDRDDLTEMASLLKQIDNLIIRYAPERARNVMIKAQV